MKDETINVIYRNEVIFKLTDYKVIEMTKAEVDGDIECWSLEDLICNMVTEVYSMIELVTNADADEYSNSDEIDDFIEKWVHFAFAANLIQDWERKHLPDGKEC